MTVETVAEEVAAVVVDLAWDGDVGRRKSMDVDTGVVVVVVAADVIRIESQVFTLPNIPPPN